MKHFTLSTLLSLFFFPALGQEVLFTEDFEGAQSGFTLNTADMGSVAGTGGENYWIVNNAYNGGSASLECFGIPIPVTIPATPAQPAGITSANGNYLHITSAAGVASSVHNCHFAAANGICVSAGNHFAAMTTDVSTLGDSAVSLDFWWLCAGGTDSYGEVYYSIDAGSTWTMVPATGAGYSGQSSWTQQSISLPAFTEQATLRFGFRFVNADALAANDPAFGIDDVSITATAAVNSITTGVLSSSTYCPGSTLSVPYTATGTWDPGNVFTAELSDAAGSFAAPVAIGSVAATASGTIAATIPVGTAVGSGYLVRVTSSDTAMISANATAINLVEAPYAGAGTHISFCETDTVQDLLSFLPGASACGNWTDPSGSPVTAMLDPATASSGAYTYTTDCPGDCPEDEAVLVIGIVPAANAGDSTSFLVCSHDPDLALFTVLSGMPEAGGTWELNGAPHNGIFTPGEDLPGCYTYTVPGVTPCLAASAQVCITVEDCTGIGEQAGHWAGLHWLGQEGPMQRLSVGTGQPEGITVHEASGRVLPVPFRRDGQHLLLDLGDVASGIYLVRLIQGDRTGTVRLVHR